jgi:hypothetical protein
MRSVFPYEGARLCLSVGAERVYADRDELTRDSRPQLLDWLAWAWGLSLSCL